MAFTARWSLVGGGYLIDKTGQPMPTFNAYCSRFGCGAQLAHNQTGEPTRAELHRGLILDDATGLYKLSNRAASLWKRARIAGRSWEQFWPAARHARPDIKSDPRPDRMPALAVKLPVQVVCPLCGYVNRIEPMADMVEALAAFRRDIGYHSPRQPHTPESAPD
jgi:hypothetical protein